MKVIYILPFLILGCKEENKKEGLDPNQKNEIVVLKNFATFSEKSINTSLVLGSGANHLYPFTDQPESFSTCIEDGGSTITPSSKVKANIFLKIENSLDDIYQKETRKIGENIALKAKDKFLSLDANSIAKSLNELAKKEIDSSSSVEVIFNASRTFKRVAIDKMAIRPEAMVGIENNPNVFYHRCGTSAVVSVIKEVKFSAKAICKKSEKHSSSDILNDIESNVNVNLVSENIFEIGGTYGLGKNLTSVLNALSKNGFQMCEWEFESIGIPTQQGSVGLIDLENLINTAQKGLDLVFQASYDEACYSQMELKPYYLFAAPEGHEEFFKRYSKELKETEETIEDLEKRANKSLNYLIVLARGTGIEESDKFAIDKIESLKMLYKAITYKKENPLLSRNYNHTF